MSRAVFPTLLFLAVFCPRFAGVCEAQGAAERSVDSLVALLESDDVAERKRAAAALGELQDPRAFSALVEALEDRSHLVRREVATALGELGDPQAIDPLVETLTDRSVRKWATASLQKIDAREAVSRIAARIDADPVKYGARAAEALRYLGESGIEKLVGLLETRENALARSVLYALRNALVDRATTAARTGIVDALIAFFKSGRGDFLHTSARIQILEVTGDPRAVRLMTRLMVDPKGNLPHELDSALKRGYLKGMAEQPFLDALADPDERVRAGTIAALGILRSTRALDFLCNAVVGDKFEPARRNAASALGKIRHPCAVEPLIVVARNTKETRSVRLAAVTSLMRFDDIRIKALFERIKIDPYEDEWIRRSVMTAGLTETTGVMESIARRLDATDPVVSVRAAVDLAVLGDMRGIERLGRALRDRDVKVRTIALEGIGRVKSPQVWRAMKLGPFFSILGNRRETIDNRRLAAGILILRDRNRVEEPLIEIFKNPAEVEKVRGFALEQLARLREKKLGDLLVDFLDHSDRALVKEVVSLLTRETKLDIGDDPRDWRAWIIECRADEYKRGECKFLGQE